MTAKDTIQVRKGEELNEKKLETFLRERFELSNAALEIEQFPTGASNLTYFIKVGDWEAVLRRPPFGPVPPKAHDMARESTVLSKIHPVFPLAPKPYIYTEDETIIGKPFFIMERRRGVVLDTDFPNGYRPMPNDGERLSGRMVEQLVALHKLDLEESGLHTIGHPDGFLERQVHGWIGRYERSKTEVLPEVDALHGWMKATIPVSGAPTVIHYDYKFNNVMFDESLENMIGIFDWEMTTVGDPLADLACTLSYWTEETDPVFLKRGLGRDPITTKPGFITRKEFMEAYTKQSGRDLTNMPFYLTFAYYKLAVICQQIYYRYHKGQTQDQRFAKMGEFAKGLIHMASIQAKKDSI
ncbi:MAG TPA: phosphotransferase family protein [Candidatus Angelobacter sp.]|nr:phosphotransferase family protein [Candidatus Angelobacter sp.]